MIPSQILDCSTEGKIFVEMIEILVANLANLLPFGYAFGAGMVVRVWFRILVQVFCFR